MTETCPASSIPADEPAPALATTEGPTMSSLRASERVVRRLSLRVAAGPDLGRVFTRALEAAGRPLRGGCSELCDLVLRDPRVSDLHFELIPQRGALVVRDLDSASGVLSGDLRVREAWLTPGASFSVGGTRLELVELDIAELPLLPFSHFGDLDGQSPAMRLLFQRLVELASRPDRGHGVLSGEAGTGKALAARSLHRFTPDRDAPFVACDLRRIPLGLVDVELFGAPTRPGRLNEAAGGVLLLQAVDELPLASQAALARALAMVPVRVIATTRRDLQRLAAAGLFDHDLHARLSGFHVVVPPLRERGRDIAFLAERLVIRLAAADDRPRSLTADALAAMREHPWPGNVRELRFVVERAHLGDGRGPIERAHLGLGRDLDSGLARVASLLRSTHVEAVAGFETLYFRHLLHAHRTKIGAARASGMTGEGFRLACRRVRVL